MIRVVINLVVDLVEDLEIKENTILAIPLDLTNEKDLKIKNEIPFPSKVLLSSVFVTFVNIFLHFTHLLHFLYFKEEKKSQQEKKNKVIFFA